MRRRLIIRAETLYDGKGIRKNATVVVEGNRIVDVARSHARPDAAGIVTPAFIDPHSHIGMHRSGEPGSESEANEQLDPVQPAHDPLNSVYFDDPAFREAVDFGVLYSCVVPGSGNPIGGRAKVIRNFAEDRDTALVHDYGFKMALGYNPRSVTAWKGSRHNTRMGVYALIESRFDALLQKIEKARIARDRKLRETEAKVRDKKLSASEAEAERKAAERESELDLDPTDRALREILVDRRPVKVHVHKEDDVCYLIGLVRRYGLKVSADHLGDVHRGAIFDQLADAGIPVVYGPLGSLPYKVELKNDDYRNAGVLLKSRAFFGLMTDHPVIMTSSLRDTLKFFLIAGMRPEEALSVVTWRNAKLAGVDDRLGCVEPGKWASLLVWPRDPLHLAAMPSLILAEGRVIRKNS